MTSPDDSRRPTGHEDAPRPVSPAVGPTDGSADGAAGTERPASERPTTGRRAAERPSTPGPAAPETATDPEPVGAGGKTAGMWIGLILGAIILVLLLIFVIQNNVTAGFQYFGAQFDLPLGVAMLLAAIAGALVMALVGSMRMVQMSWTIRKLRKQQDRIHRATR
ncbi:lipopolysaccharide assembly protein LapA domain-containing protein [Brachybacterium paraconglomeratum]|uniref:LapA family protein n=1 Tax=Brachybacterium paraconglomeratum TaxID=173362 RepID=UPI0031E8FE0E